MRSSSFFASRVKLSPTLKKVTYLVDTKKHKEAEATTLKLKTLTERHGEETHYPSEVVKSRIASISQGKKGERANDVNNN